MHVCFDSEWKITFWQWVGLNNELSNAARQPNNIVGALQIRNLGIKKKNTHTHTPAHLLAFCSARLLFLFHCFACAPVFCCAHKSLVREMKRTTGGPILMSSTSAKPVCAPVFWARSIYCTINSGCLIVSSRCFSSVVFWPQVNEFFFSASSPQEVLTSTDRSSKLFDYDSRRRKKYNW